MCRKESTGALYAYNGVPQYIGQPRRGSAEALCWVLFVSETTCLWMWFQHDLVPISKGTKEEEEEEEVPGMYSQVDNRGYCI